MKFRILFHIIKLYLWDLIPRIPANYLLKMKLLNHLKWVSREIPFYAKLNIKNFELSEFPIINKSVWIENYGDMNNLNLRYHEIYTEAKKQEQSRDFQSLHKGFTIGLSSGTSGKPGIILVSKNERALWVATVLKNIVGIKFKQRKVAFFLRSNSTLYESVKSKLLDFNYFDLTLPLEQLELKLTEYQPEIIVAPSSVLSKLFEKQDQSRQKNLIQIIAVAEVFDELTKKMLRHQFPKVKISEVYQATEGLLAFTCNRGNLHLNLDNIYAEFEDVDDYTAIDNLPPNVVRKQLIITDFIRKSQPLIRYRMGDIVQVCTDICPCGNKHTWIFKIEGREEDSLVFSNKNGEIRWLFPDNVRQWIIQSSHFMHDFYVTQIDSYRVEIQLHIDPSEFNNAKEHISKKFDEFKVLNNLGSLSLEFINAPINRVLNKKNSRVINRTKHGI